MKPMKVDSVSIKQPSLLHVSSRQGTQENLNEMFAVSKNVDESTESHVQGSEVTEQESSNEDLFDKLEELEKHIDSMSERHVDSQDLIDDSDLMGSDSFPFE